MAIFITVPKIGYKCKLTFEVQPEIYLPIKKHITRESLYHTTFCQAFVDEENPELTVFSCKKKRVRDRIKGEWKKLECEDRGEASIIILFHIFIDTYMWKCRNRKPLNKCE